MESTLTVRGKSGSSRQSRNKALTLSSTTTSTSTTSTTDSSTTDEPTRSKRENSEFHGPRYEACMVSDSYYFSNGEILFLLFGWILVFRGTHNKLLDCVTISDFRMPKTEVTDYVRDTSLSKRANWLSTRY